MARLWSFWCVFVFPMLVGGVVGLALLSVGFLLWTVIDAVHG